MTTLVVLLPVRPRLHAGQGSLPTAVPTDPLIYRFYELISLVRQVLMRRKDRDQMFAEV